LDRNQFLIKLKSSYTKQKYLLPSKNPFLIKYSIHTLFKILDWQFFITLIFMFDIHYQIRLEDLSLLHTYVRIDQFIRIYILDRDIIDIKTYIIQYVPGIHATPVHACIIIKYLHKLAWFAELKFYRKDRLNNSVFLSLLLCTKQSILAGRGNLTNAVLKSKASSLLKQIKISCYTEYRVFGPSIIYNNFTKGP